MNIFIDRILRTQGITPKQQYKLTKTNISRVTLYKMRTVFNKTSFACCVKTCHIFVVKFVFLFTAVFEFE